MNAENPYRPVNLESKADSSKPKWRGSRPFAKAKLPVWMAAYLIPSIIASVFYGCWLLAWLILGRMPRPMFDDPKSIEGAMNIAYFASFLILCSYPALILIGIASVFLCPIRLTSRIRQRILLSIGYASMCGALLALMYLDPGRVIEWYFD